MSSPAERHSLGPSSALVEWDAGSSAASGPGSRRIRSVDSVKLNKKLSKNGSPTPANRSKSAASAIETKPFMTSQLMNSLNFEKVQDDIAHPLSSLRSCSEFGMHGIQVEDDSRNSKKKKSFWRRTIGWFKGKKSDKNAEKEMSLTERSNLAAVGEQYRQQRVASSTMGTPSRDHRERMWSTQYNPRWSTDSAHSGLYTLSSERRASSSARRDSSSRKHTSHRSSTNGHNPSPHSVLIGEFSNTFWSTLGFKHSHSEPMDIEMKTFKITGAWVHTPIEPGFSPITRVPSVRSVSSRESFSGTTRPSLYGNALRPATSVVVDISVFDIVFSDLWHVVYVSESFKICAEYFFWIIDYSRYLSFSLGEEQLLDAMRIQPVTTSNYFRALLCVGVVSSLFNGSTLLAMHGGFEDEARRGELTSGMGYFMYGFLLLITVLNLVQLPFRINIHLRLLKVPQVSAHEAGDILRDLTEMDSWIFNKVLNWFMDAASLCGLAVAEVYMHSFMPPVCVAEVDAEHCPLSEDCSQSNALGNIVVTTCATLILMYILRSVVALLFCASAADPQTLMEARKRGLSKYDVDKLPTFVFSDRDDVNNPVCSICLCSFELGEMLICLPCDNRHSFHAGCIRDWLLRQNACPLCQKLV